ncbi:MAG: cytochrome P450 [Kutzneria sp.]|nr:cytochrome P450 [Kutzneria sp.]
MPAASSTGDPTQVPAPLTAKDITVGGIGPVCRGRLTTGIDAWLVTRYDEVAAALTDHRLVMSAPEIQADLVARGELPERFGSLFQRRTKTLLSTDPPEHTRLRRLVNPSFVGRRIEALRPRAQEICDGLAAAMAVSADSGQAVDVISSFAFPLSVMMICELLGVPAKDREKFREWSQAIVFDHGDRESVAAYAQGAASLDEYFGTLVECKRTQPAEDLVSQLVASYELEPVTDDAELRAMLSLLLIAGYETTANLIGNSVLLLSRHPDQLAVLRHDPTLLPAAVEECLRHVGPVAFSSMRFTTDDIQFGEVTVPRGQVVALGLWAADHDPERFTDPNTFDVSRKDNTHLAFGRGAHFCVGAALARMEAQVGLGTLVRLFDRFTLGVTEDELRWRPANTRGPRQLPIVLTRRPVE